MAGKSRRSKLVLLDEDRAELEQLSRSRTLPHRGATAPPSFWVLGGESIASIGRRLGMTRLSVSKWGGKALAVGPMAALKDSYHRPKEPVIGDDAKAWVVHLACSKPKDLGLRGRSLESASAGKACPRACRAGGFPALSRAPKQPCIESWRNNLLHPEKVKYYLERRDPDFEGGMRRVLIVYQVWRCRMQTGRWRGGFQHHYCFGGREAWSQASVIPRLTCHCAGKHPTIWLPCPPAWRAGRFSASAISTRCWIAGAHAATPQSRIGGDARASPHAERRVSADTRSREALLAARPRSQTLIVEYAAAVSDSLFDRGEDQ